ncbi:MAG: Adenylate cyclase, class 3, partial [Chthonomonadales bacterium]|nr:Adenylate cyclase, class 3 [Chthonomonadales bacterium]
MRDRLIFLWNLQHSPDRRVQYGWYLTVTAVFLLVIGLPSLRTFVTAALGGLGFFYGLVAGVWGIFHPRSLLPAVPTIWRWASWLTVLMMITLYAGLLQLAVNFLPVAMPTVGMLFITLILLPILFLVLFFHGLVGAAVCAFTGRRWPESARTTRVGANTWWLLTLGSLVAVLTSRLSFKSEEARIFYLAQVPLAVVPFCTAFLCALARDPEREPRRVGERLLQRLTRYLTYRRRWRKRTLEIDLRGAVLGRLVGAAVFGLLRPILKAPSASLLVWMIQLRNQEAQGAWPSPETDDSSGLFGDGLVQRDKEVLEKRRQIALIDLDTSVLRAAFAPAPSPATSTAPKQPEVPSTRSSKTPAARRPEIAVQSEAALDALLVRRLYGLGAAVIVLFSPQDGRTPKLDNKSTVAATDTEAKRRQSLKDEPLLVAAVKEAGNVVLALPTSDPGLRSRLQVLLNEVRPASPELRGAARAVAVEELYSYGSIRLPVLPPEDPKKPFSLPLTVAQLYARVAQPNASYGFQGHSLTPVNFGNAKPTHDFLHIAASSLVTPSTIEEAGEERIVAPDGQWRKLGESVRGRIVFLDTRITHLRETPVGALPVREVLAYATATVLAHKKGLRVATTRNLLLTLMVGTLMGALCAHKTPFEAVGRLMGVATLIVFASLLCYVFWTLWLDAVVPLAAILLTYLLVTQLAFTQQREKNRDLLKRFVAPEFVDAMLDHPSD